VNEPAGPELTTLESPHQAESGQVILQLVGITRSYGHVRALRGVDLDLRRGEILGLVGDNGAGKSTLMKIIAGTERADEGTIAIDGKQVDIRVAADARRLGIEMIYQHLALFDNLDIAANIFIGREPTRGIHGLMGFVARRRTHRAAAELLSHLKLQIHSTRLLVKSLSGGQRQMVAIARAVAFADTTRIVIMDEPSAALGATESKTVIDAISSLRTHGHSIIVISHRLPELLELCDRITILKQGEKVATVRASETTIEQCVNLIVAGRAAVANPSAS
jgi:ABC-type sugar transport system ATPase subunit